MSVVVHCDSPECFNALYSLTPKEAPVGITIHLTPDDYLRERTPMGNEARTFCGYGCMADWATAKGYIGEVR